MIEFKIEKGIPLAAETRGRKRKYPWPEMEVGDSIFVAGQSSHDKGGKRSAYTSAQHYARRRDLKFAVRTVTEDGVDGVRIWRVE